MKKKGRAYITTKKYDTKMTERIVITRDVDALAYESARLIMYIVVVPTSFYSTRNHHALACACIALTSFFLGSVKHPTLYYGTTGVRRAVASNRPARFVGERARTSKMRRGGGIQVLGEGCGLCSKTGTTVPVVGNW